MKLTGTHTFEAPRDAVWEALLDPNVIAKIMPGCERLEKTGENSYEGEMKVKVGPVEGKFKGSVKLENIEEGESYDMDIDARGSSGFMKGDGHIELKDGDEEGQTRLEYSVDAQVGGRVANVGQRLLDSTAKSVTRQSLQTLDKLIQARQSGSGEDVEGPSATRMATGVAKDVVKDLFSRKKKDN